MKTTTMKLTIFTVAAAVLAATSSAQTTATTPPVGYYKLGIQGASDNIMSLPMVRDAVFSGTVGTIITDFGFDVLSGTASPNWSVAPKQFVYAAGTQRLNYYVEFTSGQLKGLYYKIADNGTGSLAVDTEGDILTDHPINGDPAALAPGDGITIRPYWTIKDVFEVAGAPIIEGRQTAFSPKDDVLIPDYSAVSTNKSAVLTIYYLNGSGWREFNSGAADLADFILRPNEAFIVRRRNVAAISLTNLGSVLTNRSVYLIPGGDGTNGNDTYLSISRPAPVKLDDSGLRNANQSISVIIDTQFAFNPQDLLLAFNSPGGFNEAPAKTYYYLENAGWRDFNNPSDTTVGQTVFLEPGKVYIVRKKATNNLPRDWVNDSNY